MENKAEYKMRRDGIDESSVLKHEIFTLISTAHEFAKRGFKDSAYEVVLMAAKRIKESKLFPDE